MQAPESTDGYLSGQRMDAEKQEGKNLYRAEGQHASSCVKGCTCMFERSQAQLAWHCVAEHADNFGQENRKHLAVCE